VHIWIKNILGGRSRKYKVPEVGGFMVREDKAEKIKG
jgi:hypothetical protein